MDFLEYSNKNHCNIIPKAEFDGLVLKTFNIIADNITKSLGPLGSSATIFNGKIEEATKDGYQILKNYRFRNRYMAMIYNLIFQPCTKVNNTVGDATTTVIALTNELFNTYNKYENSLLPLYRLPRQFNKAWDEVIEELCKKSAEKATPIDPSDYDTIYNIAYVVSNGSAEISHEMAKVYKEAKSPSIKQKDSPTNKSYIAPVNGFEYPANIIDEIFIKNQDGTTEETNIMTMLFDHIINQDIFMLICKINNIMRARGHKLLIISPGYDNKMLDTIVNQYIQSEFMQYGCTNLILTGYKLGDIESNQMTDLAVILRSKHITQTLEEVLKTALESSDGDSIVESILEDENSPLYRIIGYADKVMLTFNTGAIFQVKDIESDQRYIDVLNKAKNDLKNIIANTNNELQSYSMKIYDAQARIMQLEMKNYIYYVGANSNLQKQITWAAIEDVIKCVRSAIKTGVVPGCQISLIKSCAELLEEISEGKNEKDMNQEQKLKCAIIEIITNALTNVYSRVLHGPEKLGIIKTLPRWDKTKKDGIEELIEEATEKANNIILESISCNKVFDLETLEYNANIITSAETDRMVLTAASDLVKILISGNQCIVVDPDVDGSHEETIMM